MKLEIWSDVVCPWCYVGKRQLEAALARFEHRSEVDLIWRSYELSPDSPRLVGVPMTQILQRKYGMSAEQADAANDRITGLAAGLGLEYHLDKAQAGNSFDAHRLIHLAAETGRADAMEERLFAAYFTEGQPVGDPVTLVGLAGEVGIDFDEARAMLESDRFAADVRHDEERAAALGITGVPFFVIDEAYGVSGAQGEEIILRALEQAWSASHPLQHVPAGDPATSCSDDSCPL
jgi:predicted DsbA family dithiol-disulfide isomerase